MVDRCFIIHSFIYSFVYSFFYSYPQDDSIKYARVMTALCAVRTDLIVIFRAQFLSSCPPLIPRFPEEIVNPGDDEDSKIDFNFEWNERREVSSLSYDIDVLPLSCSGWLGTILYFEYYVVGVSFLFFHFFNIFCSVWLWWLLLYY